MQYLPLFKEGDIVRVKLTAGENSKDPLTFANSMIPRRGEQFRVIEVVGGRDYPRYKLEGCGRNVGNTFRLWLWAEEWLEPLYTNNINDISDKELIDLFH